MDTFIRESSDERRIVFEEAGNRLGLPPASLEKDFWVCWTLRQLFELDEIGSALVFKGGTSLSKVWKLIDRFSEDIDVVIGRDRLGFGGEASPELARSKKQLRKRMAALKSACQEYIAASLEPALRDSLLASLGGGYELLGDLEDHDRMTLLFRYPTVFPEPVARYLRREVKIELGARSDTWPASAMTLRPYAAEALPEYFKDSAVAVRAITAERTCLDKILLLHEENLRPPGKPKKERLSRHYYDLHRLILAGVAQRAVADAALLARALEHRSAFFAYSWVSYESFSLKDAHLSPREEARPFWQDDYRKMREEMFFGEPPGFEETLRVVAEFEQELRGYG